MKLKEKVKKKGKNFIKDCYDNLDTIDFNARTIDVEAETDYKKEKFRLFFNLEAGTLEYTVDYSRWSNRYNKYTNIHVNFLDEHTIRVVKESTYTQDGRVIMYVKTWLIKTVFDYTPHINSLKELALKEINNCVEAFIIINSFNLFSNLVILNAVKSGEVVEYTKEVYEDKADNLLRHHQEEDDWEDELL